jgi:recombination associated protein RdgC
MTFDDRVSFILTEKMEIKRVAFLDVIKEEAEKQADAADMQMEADFALMSGELSRLIPALIEVLGGEQPDGVIDLGVGNPPLHFPLPTTQYPLPRSPR